MKEKNKMKMEVLCNVYGSRNDFVSQKASTKRGNFSSLAQYLYHHQDAPV